MCKPTSVFPILNHVGAFPNRRSVLVTMSATQGDRSRGRRNMHLIKPLHSRPTPSPTVAQHFTRLLSYLSQACDVASRCKYVRLPSHPFSLRCHCPATFCYGSPRSRSFVSFRYWNKTATVADLISVSEATQLAAWTEQQSAGIASIGLDGTMYDQMLDTTTWLGVIPARFQVRPTAHVYPHAVLVFCWCLQAAKCPTTCQHAATCSHSLVDTLLQTFLAMVIKGSPLNSFNLDRT